MPLSFELFLEAERTIPVKSCVVVATSGVVYFPRQALSAADVAPATFEFFRRENNPSTLFHLRKAYFSRKKNYRARKQSEPCEFGSYHLTMKHHVCFLPRHGLVNMAYTSRTVPRGDKQQQHIY